MGANIHLGLESGQYFVMFSRPVVVPHQSAVEEEVLGLSDGIFAQQQPDQSRLAGSGSSDDENVGSLLQSLHT